MSETTSPRSRPIEELEAAIFETIEPYFEGYLKEVQESKGRVGAGFCKYEEARQQVANVEMELEQICQRTEEIMAAEALNSVLQRFVVKLHHNTVSTPELAEEVGLLR